MGKKPDTVMRKLLNARVVVKFSFISLSHITFTTFYRQNVPTLEYRA